MLCMFLFYFNLIHDLSLFFELFALSCWTCCTNESNLISSMCKCASQFSCSSKIKRITWVGSQPCIAVLWKCVMSTLQRTFWICRVSGAERDWLWCWQPGGRVPTPSSPSFTWIMHANYLLAKKRTVSPQVPKDIQAHKQTWISTSFH